MRRNLDRLPKVDEKATKKEVEKELFEYRDYLITLPTYFFPKITPTYSFVPPTQTNQFHSNTENTALERIEYEENRDFFINKINNAVNGLKEMERNIIIKRYMLQDIGYDPDIWSELGIGKTKYYDIKGEAMLRLAFALQVEVYKKKEVVAV